MRRTWNTELAVPASAAIHAVFSWRRTSWRKNRRAREMKPNPTTLLHDGNTCGGHHNGASYGMIGWREEGRRWNPVASGEGEEHHAYSGHQEEQSDGGYLGDWQMGSSTTRDTPGDHF